jgi:hypothetical protein
MTRIRAQRMPRTKDQIPPLQRLLKKMKEGPDITVLQYYLYFHDHIGSAWVSLVIFIVLIWFDIRLVSRLGATVNVDKCNLQPTGPIYRYYAGRGLLRK